MHPAMIGNMTTNAASGPTNFLNDANMQGLWCTVNNLNDRSSKANNLTKVAGTAAYSTTCVTGTYSFNSGTAWEATLYAANAATGFPGKGTTAYMTVGGWIRPTSVTSPTSQLMVSIYLSALNWAYFLGYSGGYVWAGITGTDNNVYGPTTTTTVGANAWTFLAMTLDGSNVRVYKATGDGSNLAEINGSPVAMTVGVKNGSSGGYLELPGGSTDCYVKGLTNDLGVMNRALSAAELTSVAMHGWDGSR